MPVSALQSALMTNAVAYIVVMMILLGLVMMSVADGLVGSWVAVVVVGRGTYTLSLLHDAVAAILGPCMSGNTCGLVTHVS